MYDRILVPNDQYGDGVFRVHWDGVFRVHRDGVFRVYRDSVFQSNCVD